MKITSSQNPKIKKIVKLKHRKTRDLMGLTLIDGVREVQRAYAGGAHLTEILICPELLASHGGENVQEIMGGWAVPLCEVSKEAFVKLCFGDRKEGVVAVCETKTKYLSQIHLRKNPLVVVIERVEKPGNLGAILRTCDGAGVDALFICDPQTDVYNPNVIRSSMGAIFSVPVVQGTNLQIEQFFKDRNITPVVTSPRAKVTYWNADFQGAKAIVLGSEDQGLSDFWFKNCELHVSLPMKGKADSLNVSTTAAILMYEALRQRR